MKNIITVNKWLAALSIILVLASCKKYLQIEQNPTLIETEDVFINDNTALSAVSGLYSRMVATNLSLSNGGSTIFPALTADELINNSNPGYDPFRSNSIPSTNSSVNTIWNNAYTNIYHINSIIKGLTNATNISAAVKNQLLGEVKFVRAFFYFYLVNFFGDVPLVVETDYKENAIKARTPVATIFQQIVNDLTDAKSLLGPTYPSSGRVRPNKWTATALLARVYLYLKDWPNAEVNASAVINSSLYSIAGNLNSVFLATSTEAIWQLMRETSNTVEGNTLLPISSTQIPVFSATSYLLNAFEQNDARKTNWLKANTVSGQEYFYPYKYKVRSGSNVTEYMVVLRLAEQYLIRAEALAQQNKITEAQADMNKIRNRAQLPSVVAADKASLLHAIKKERQTELFAEWGHRWFDLKRWDDINAVLGTVKAPNWQATDALFPIPKTEMDSNPFLIQNDGY